MLKSKDTVEMKTKIFHLVSGSISHPNKTKFQLIYDFTQKRVPLIDLYTLSVVHNLSLAIFLQAILERGKVQI